MYRAMGSRRLRNRHPSIDRRDWDVARRWLDDDPLARIISRLTFFETVWRVSPPPHPVVEVIEHEVAFGRVHRQDRMAFAVRLLDHRHQQIGLGETPRL